MRSSREVFRLAVLTTVLFAAGCTKEAPPASPAPGAGAAAPTPAVVLFVSGNVETQSAAGRTTVKVGDAIAAGQTLATGARSECELRLGGQTTVRIEERTEFTLSEAVLDSGRNQVGIGLAAGRIRCKVARLTGNERFRVRTPTAVVGVRGTEFGVTVSAAGGTVLSVQRGAVAILPASIDVDALAARLTTDDPEVSAALAELGKAELVVREDEQAVVTETAFRNADETRKRIEQAIESVSGSERPTARQKQAFAAVIRNAASEIHGSMVAPGDSPAPIDSPAPTDSPAPAAAHTPERAPDAVPANIEAREPVALEIRNGSFERPADGSGELKPTEEWTAGGSWYGRLAQAPAAAKDGSCFVWASYQRGGPGNGYSQELGARCVVGRYTLSVWINADARGLESRAMLGYDAGNDDYGVIGTGSLEAPYGLAAGAAWGSSWIRQTLVVDVKEGDPAVGKPLWVRFTTTTAPAPRRPDDTGSYGNSVSWDGVTLTLSPSAGRGE
jgi:hypothetical protein